MKRFLLSFAAIFVALSAMAQSHASAKFQPTYWQYHNITPGVLEAVSWTKTRMKHLENVTPGCSGIPVPFGIMGVHDDGKDYFIENGKYIAKLSGISVDEQKSSASKAIEAYGYAYNHLMTQEIANGGNKFDGKSIRNVLWQLSEIPDSGLVNMLARDIHVYEVLRFLNDNQKSTHFEFTDYNISLEEVFGTANYAVLSSPKIQFTEAGIQSESGVTFSAIGASSMMKSLEYGPATWTPAPACNFSTRNTSISAITIHTIQGSYDGAISWAQNCNSNVSYHYVIKSSDGQVTQMVLEADKAWHVGSENNYTIGYEHEGFVDDPVWYTNAMYNSSADLSRDIVNSGYGIPPLRTFFGDATVGINTLGGCTKIKGHQHYPNQSHTDPGVYWDWERYYKLINNTPTYTSITATSGNFYDTGGPTGNYQDDERELWLFQPTSAQSVTLNFTAFDLEVDYDFLFIYDGADVNAPLIGKYTGTNSPGTVTSSSGSIVVEFRSDCGTTSPGWEVNYTSVQGDFNPPTTSIAAGPMWQTDDFSVMITDTDAESGVEQGYYLAGERDITDNGWRSKGTYGFVHEDFEDVNLIWTNQVGLHTVSNGAFIYSDVNEQNSNAYASVTQDVSTKFLFEWDQTITSSGSNQRAGMHFFCDAPTLPNRGNSYFVYLREATDKLQVYRVTNDVFSVVEEVSLTVAPGTSYNCKVTYDPTTGLIKVYVDDALVAEWTDPQPLTSGNSISIRTGGCSASFDNVHVYRSRAGQVDIPAGFGELMSIESENAIETGLVKSIAVDMADNWSSITSETYLLDFSAPEMDYVFDGTSSDIDTFMTATFEANWDIFDVHSDISAFTFAIGTAPGLDDVVSWTNNSTSTSITEVLSAPIQNQLYYVSVRAENNAGWESEFSSDGQRYVNNVGIDELEEIFASIVLYPNPASESLQIDGLPAESQLYLIDGKGALIEITTNNSTIDVSHFARGNYQLMIKVGSVFTVKKVVLR